MSRICSFCQLHIPMSDPMVGGVGRARICAECANNISKLFAVWLKKGKDGGYKKAEKVAERMVKDAHGNWVRDKET